MKEKQYLISESELKNVFDMGVDGEDFNFDDFLAGKQPVGLIASGEVNCIGSMPHNKNDKGSFNFYSDYVKEHEGKHIDIYIKERKE